MKKTKPKGQGCAGCQALQRDASWLLARSESERAEAARILHDDIGQKLTVASIELSLWRDEIAASRRLSADAVRQHLRVLSELVGSMVGGARTLSGSLRPRAIEVFGVVAAVESRMEKFRQRTGIACQLQVPDALDLDSLVAIQFFRVFEALIDACGADADCTRLEVTITPQRSGVELSVRTDAACVVPDEVAARSRVFGWRIQCDDGAVTVWISGRLPA